MNTIAEFAAQHGFETHNIQQFVYKHRIPVLHEQREVRGKCGSRWLRDVAILTPEAEERILSTYGKSPNAGRVLIKKHNNLSAPIMSEFERFLVTMHRKFKEQASTQDIIAVTIDKFGPWREQVGRSELVSL